MNRDVPVIKTPVTHDDCRAVGMPYITRGTSLDWGAVAWKGKPGNLIYQPYVAEDDARLPAARAIAGAEGIPVQGGRWSIPTSPLAWFFIAAAAAYALWIFVLANAHVPMVGLLLIAMISVVTVGVPAALKTTVPTTGVKQLPDNDIVVWAAQEAMARGADPKVVVHAMRTYAFTDIDQESVVDVLSRHGDTPVLYEEG